MKTKQSLLALAAIALLTSCGGNQPSVTSDVSIPSEPSSASSASIAKYTVSASECVGGSVSFERSEYEEGETVNFTVSPDSGYSVNEVTSSQTEITKGEGNAYSFTMPAQNVVVNASFSAVHRITSVLNLAPTSQYASVEVDVDKEYAVGEEVVINIMPGSSWESGFYRENITNVYVHVNGAYVKATYPDGQKNRTYVTHWVAKFAMPDEDVEIAVVQNSYNYTGTSGHKLSVQCEGGVRAYGYNENVTNYTSFVLTLVRPESTMVSVEYSFDQGQTWSDLGLEKDYTTGAYWNSNVATTSYSYDFMKSDCIVRAIATSAETQPITYVNADSVTLSYGSLPTSILPGEPVGFSYKEADGKYYTVPATIEGVANVASNDGSYISFTMPNNPVTITFNLERGIDATIESNTDVLSASMRRSLMGDVATSFIPGGDVYLNLSDIKLRPNKLVSKIYLNDVEMEYSSGYFGKYYHGTAPLDGAITIRIETSGSYNIVVNEAEGGAAFVDTDKATVGKTITGTYYETGMWSLDHFDVKDAAENDRTEELAIDVQDGTFSFTMPKFDVYLTPVFVKATGYEVALYIGESDYSKIVSDVESYSRSYIYSSKSSQFDSFPRAASEGNKTFKSGEKLGASIKVTDNSYSVKVKWTASNGESTIVEATTVTAYEEYTCYYFSVEDSNAYVINSNTTFSLIFETIA